MKFVRNFIFLSLFLVSSFFIFDVLPKYFRATNFQQKIVIGENTFTVELADTPSLRAMGLSGRYELPENTGMLFIFDNPGMPGFWMKNMNFPIDIIWISGDEVVGVEENLLPDDTPRRQVYYPPTLIDSVLEVPAGTVFGHNIKMGDYVRIDRS